MTDWRKDYVCCEHVKEDSQDTRHQAIRVCCEDCYKKDFLFVDELDVKEINGYAIGKLKQSQNVKGLRGKK